MTTFPSLTPVCLTSIATGAHPDVHHIPHLVWWHRGEQRIVEYGSSFGAIRAAGTRRSIRDTIVGMNRDHLSKDAETIYEARRARRPHRRRREHHVLPRAAPLPADGARASRRRRSGRAASSSTTSTSRIRSARRSRFATARGGSVDEYAAAAGRWLVTRDGFDLLVYYLSDLDFASHVHGPDGVREQLVQDRRQRARRSSMRPADSTSSSSATRCSCARTTGRRTSTAPRRLQDHVHAPAIVTASNRAGMIYTDEPRVAAASLDGVEAVDAVFFLEDGAVVARRDGDEDPAILDEYPLGRERVEAALRNPNAGEVLVSAAPGWEFADLAGLHHAGGGSHGSLAAGDSEVPMLGIGIEPPRADDRREGCAAREPALARAVIDARAAAWSSSSSLARDIRRRARARGDGARAARALRARGAARAARTTTRRSRSAADRRSRSRRWSR